MNTQTGKSIGIALLLAAGLIAVLFAFGVFSPQATPGVSAHDCQEPGDDHEDNADPGLDCTEGAHADGDHVRPTFGGPDYNSDDNRYEFSIRENLDGSTNAIDVGQVMATVAGGVTLAFTGAPTDFTTFPSGHVQYGGSGLDFEGTHEADGDRKYLTGTFQVTAIKTGDADPGLADRTATTTIRIYIEDQDGGPPAAPKGAPVMPRAADSTASPPITAISAEDAAKMMTVSWGRADGIVSASTYSVRYREAGETEWESTIVTTAAGDSGATPPTFPPTMATISGLDPKTDYEIQVRVDTQATDDNNNEWSATGTGETASLPAKVKIAVSSDGQDSGELMVSWTNEDNTMHDGGGDSEASYKVEYGEGRSFNENDPTLQSAEIPGDESSTTLSNLDNGTLYHVRVIAMNRVGDADASDSASATPYGLPTAPQNLQVIVVDDTNLLASWEAPADTGGYDSVSYGVSYNVIGSTDVKEMTTNSTTATLSGLDDDTGYLVMVKATNDRGDSPATTAFGRTQKGPAVVTAVLNISHAPDADMFFEPGAEQAQSRSVSGMLNGAAALNLEFSAVSSDTDVVTVARPRNTIDTNGDVTAATVTVNPVGPGTATVTVTATMADGSQSDTTTWNVTVLGVVSSTYKADADVVLEVVGRAERAVLGGRDIVVELPGYFIPEGGIDENDVLVTGAGTSYYGNPADVAVSGSDVTVTIPTKVVGPGGESVDTEVGVGGYIIRFKDGADLRNPNSAGNKTITVSDSDATDHELPVTIISHISVKPGWVMRGNEFAVTGKGINAAGDSTVHLYTKRNNRGQFLDRNDRVVDPADLDNLDLVESSVSLVLGRSLRDAGTVVVEGIDTTHSKFVADAINATATTDAKGYNLIVMVDAAGNNVGQTYLGIQPTVKLDVTEVRRTGRVEISVSDWYYGDITDAFINGIQVKLPDGDDEGTEPDDWGSNEESVGSDKKASFTVIVDRNVRLGKMEVELVGTTQVKQGKYNNVDAHKQTVDVGFFNLTLTPSTAVTDQVIRIEGTGFGANVCIVEITVGEEKIEEATTGDRVRIGDLRDCVLTDSDGDMANSFKVPYNLAPDDYKVVVRDVNNRVGEAVLTVPKPAITLSPEASQRGSTVTIVGENFPAQDVIGITYGGDTVTVATTDTVGKWRATFKVPVDSTIGREYEVVAQSDKKGDGQQTGPTTPPKRANLNAKAVHTVPEETLKVWPRGQAEPPDDTEDVPAINYGGRLEVKATNLPPHTKVSLWIGSIPVAGRVLGEDAAADSAGRYTDSVLVPQLTPGTHTVELAVHTIGSDVVVVTFVEILDIVTRPTTDVFEDLIAAGQLVVVWHYDNETATWAAYDPNIPPHINDLNLLSTGDIVWVEVTERVQFQGQTLFAGANLISLD